MSVKALREIIFKEWLDYVTDYLGFSTAYSFRCVCMYMDVYVYVYMHYMHIHIHIYIYTHTYIYIQKLHPTDYNTKRSKLANKN